MSRQIALQNRKALLSASRAAREAKNAASEHAKYEKTVNHPMKEGSPISGRYCPIRYSGNHRNTLSMSWLSVRSFPRLS